MTTHACLPSAGGRLAFWHIAAVLALVGPCLAPAEWIFSGLPIENRKFQISVNEFGYSDSLLDRRWKFRGREYLSGEWAGAVYYEGGQLPAMTRWLPDRFVFPDFYTSEPRFGIEQGFRYADPFNPTNAYGFPAFQSSITNADLRVTMTYEMMDLGTNETARLAMGLAPNGQGGAGSNLFSGRYVFRQGYTLANISGKSLSNLRFFQFIHTLEGDWIVYDGRMYGGGLPDYHYTLSQQGKSYGFNQRTYETVEHTDTLSVVFNRMPVGLEVGAFGMKASDNHQTNSPSVGVHRSVEANSLGGQDFYNPNGAAWVSGAAAFDLGSLAPAATVSIDVLLAIKSTYTVVSPPLNVVVHNARLEDSTFTIDFEETTGNPRVGYLLRQATELGPMPVSAWQPLPLPYFRDVPIVGWNRFQVPVDRSKPELLFAIQPQIIQAE